jgi:hypothetical protein
MALATKQEETALDVVFVIIQQVIANARKDTGVKTAVCNMQDGRLE